MCHFRDARCHDCGKKVTSSRCVVPKKKPSYRSIESAVREQYVTTAGSDTDEDLPIKLVGSRLLQSHPIVVPVSINGKQLSMQVDTGAAVSILSEKTFQSNFPDAVLKPAAVTLCTCTGQPMAVVGQLTIFNLNLTLSLFSLLQVTEQSPPYI